LADWLTVLSEDNWEICAARGLLGFGSRAERKLAIMSEGDRVWIYVNKKYVDQKLPWLRRIRGLARITGPSRSLDSVPWRARGDQAFGFAKPITVESHLDIEATPLLKAMSFAGKSSLWGAPLQNAPLKLTARDVSKLERAVAESLIF
jgi:hypothetical protein